MTRHFAVILLLFAASACGGEDSLSPGAGFAIRVVDFTPGERAGFGEDGLPDVVLGPPRGLGRYEGSLDVLSLGVGGEVTLELGAAAVDGPGADLIIFENPFLVGGTSLIFAEPGIVSVSEHGDRFVELPCAAGQPPYVGCAGVTPVMANADENGIDATDAEAAGGDAFDLAGTGLIRARFVRIRDAGLDARGFGTDNAGFDLDAIAVVNAAE